MIAIVLIDPLVVGGHPGGALLALNLAGMQESVVGKGCKAQVSGGSIHWLSGADEGRVLPAGGGARRALPRIRQGVSRNLYATDRLVRFSERKT
jgi:hypothetical protein